MNSPNPAVQKAVWSAFQRSDWLERLIPATFVLPLVFCVWVLGARDAETTLFGALAISGAVGTMYLGRNIRRLALPAILVGICPLGCGLLAAHGGHICMGGVCSTWCVPACSGGGLVAGVLLGRLWQRREASGREVLVTGILSWAVAALGCSCAGHSGMVGMSLGLVGGALLGRMWGRHPVANG